MADLTLPLFSTMETRCMAMASVLGRGGGGRAGRISTTTPTHRPICPKMNRVEKEKIKVLQRDSCFVVLRLAKPVSGSKILNQN